MSRFAAADQKLSIRKQNAATESKGGIIQGSSCHYLLTLHLPFHASLQSFMHKAQISSKTKKKQLSYFCLYLFAFKTLQPCRTQRPFPILKHCSS